MADNNEMKCRNEKCPDGIVDTNKTFSFSTVCRRPGYGHRCKVCGLLHSENGNKITTQSEKPMPIYVDVDGHIMEVAKV